ncbi:MAG: SMC-Scp complex subunit ScpB [Sedimentisphaerales bacterium]|nr:SMC-Scp complex subunit ScpB [Sedimentisphaerales bacterium]
MTEEQQENIEATLEDNEQGAEPIEEQPADDVSEEAIEQEPEQADKQPAFAEPDEPIETTIESVVEAVLFASDEPLSPTRLAAIVETTTKEIKDSIKNLNERYKAGNHAFRIEQIAGGFQMLTLSPYNTWLQKLLRARSDSKLSAAALETLAIISYKQPIIRADIEAIRGVAAGEMIRSLMYKGLVKIVGRAEILGRPMLYGTTKKFLEVFGLNTLKDLPKIEELKKPEQ